MYTYEVDKARGYDGTIVVLKHANYENACGSYIFKSWVIETLGL